MAEPGFAGCCIIALAKSRFADPEAAGALIARVIWGDVVRGKLA